MILIKVYHLTRSIIIVCFLNLFLPNHEVKYYIHQSFLEHKRLLMKLLVPYALRDLFLDLLQIYIYLILFYLELFLVEVVLKLENINLLQIHNPYLGLSLTIHFQNVCKHFYFHLDQDDQGKKHLQHHQDLIIIEQLPNTMRPKINQGGNNMVYHH